MFDVGFSELMVIAVVALIVIGPERLPKVARTMGHLFGRMQRYVADVKSDINREMNLDEVRKLQDEFKSAAQTAEHTFTDEVVKTEHMIKALPDTPETPDTGALAGESEQQAIAAEDNHIHADAPKPQLELGFENQSDPSSNTPKQA